MLSELSQHLRRLQIASEFKRFFPRKRSTPIRVVIYGNHSEDWMSALAPDADVWIGLMENCEISVEHVDGGSINRVDNKEALTVVIPLMENHIADYSANRSKGDFSLLPSTEALEILRNKSRFFEYCRAQNLLDLVPATYLNTECAQFPCLLKRTDLNAGNGIAVAHSSQHLDILLQEETWKNEPYILQSIVQGECDYVTHCICNNGSIIWHHSYKYPLDPNNMIRRSGLGTETTTPPSSLIADIETFIAPLSYSGPCNIDYKLTEDGRIVVLEINPRLGGSLMTPNNLPELKQAMKHLLTTSLLNGHAKS